MVLPWKGLTLTWSTGWDLVCTSCTFLTYSIEETSPHFCTCLQRATWDFDLWYVPATRLHTSGHPILICFQLSGFHKYLLPWAILQCGHNMFHSRYGGRGIMANGYPQLTHTLLKAIPSLLFSLGLFSFTWSLYCSNAWLYGPPNYHPAICWLWLQRPQVHIHAFFYRFCIQFIHSLGGFWAINCWFWVTSVFDKWTCFWRVSSRIPLLLLTNKKKTVVIFIGVVLTTMKLEDQSVGSTGAISSLGSLCTWWVNFFLFLFLQRLETPGQTFCPPQGLISLVPIWEGFCTNMAYNHCGSSCVLP